METLQLELLNPGSPDPFREVNLSAENTEGTGKSGWSVTSRILRGGLQEGVQVVEVNNGRLSFAVLPSRGMGIWKGQCGDVRLGWDSPVKDPVHPAFIHLQDCGGIGWLKGFNEWFVRCGLNSMGAPGTDSGTGQELTLHGNIANIPARAVSIEIDAEAITVKGEVLESMLFGPALRLNTEIRSEFGSGSLTVTDTVTNPGDLPAEHQMLYHINYGGSLLEEGSRMRAPFNRMAPRNARAAEGIDSYDRYGPPQPGFEEQVYLYELIGKGDQQQTLAMLRNAAGDRASVLRFGLKDLPCFTQWKNTAGRADGYVTGLEPGTGFPNVRGYEREKGRVLSIPGGGSRSIRLTVEVLESSAAVEAVETEIRELQQAGEGRVFENPHPEFSEI